MVVKTHRHKQTGIGYGCRRGSGNCGRRTVESDAAILRRRRQADGAACYRGRINGSKQFRLQPFLEAQFYAEKNFLEIAIDAAALGDRPCSFLCWRGEVYSGA